jgi:hypothetical protein
MCENQLPPAVQAWVTYLTPSFWASPSDTVTLSHGLVIGTPGSHPLHLHQHRQYHLQQQILEPRVSVFLFNHGAFLWQAAFFPSTASVKAAFKLSFLLVIRRESSPFIWPSGPPSGCLGCCSLEWQPDSLLALSLRLLASAELCSTGPAYPA